MKLIVCIFLTVFPLLLFGQKDVDLKKRYFGSYEGLIPGYSIDVGNEVVEVTATPIEIEIEEERVNIKIGQNTMTGTYDVMFKASSYFLIDVKIDGQMANERIMIYKRGKKISRDGLYPQPMAALKKVR